MVRLIESIIGASRIIVAAAFLAGLCGSVRRMAAGMMRKRVTRLRAR
jgi:hypothetical protein